MDTETNGQIDSNCFAPDRGSERQEDRCGADATTYVRLPSGVRRYVCPDCAEDVDRFDEVDESHPNVGVCSRCRRLTPVDHIDTVDGLCDECRE